MTTFRNSQPTSAGPTLGLGTRIGRHPNVVAWSLVAMYVILIAGRSIAPNVFRGSSIVALLLPLVFLLVHGTRAYGMRATLVFGAIVLVVSNVFENLSIATGFPFGDYAYPGAAGPRVLDVPLMIGIAYLGMAYPSWTLARLLLGSTRGPVTGASLVAVPIVASFVMVAWDLTFDPVSSTINGFWIWEHGGSYFGVPFSNFLGWFLTVLVFFSAFAAYLSRRSQRATVPEGLSGHHWLQAVALYAAAAIPALLGPLTHPVIGQVADPAGTIWRGEDIYLGVALVAIFTMVAFAVLGALRAREIWTAAS
jgi:uncharacterized membrane protein